MSLTKSQMQEIVAFDMKRRTGLDFDGRRFGSITGAHAPHLTETWGLCHGSEVFKGKEKPARKTLRYNYIVPDRARGKARPDVTVVHVAVRLNGAYQPVVKDVGRWHIKTGHLELRDIDFHGLGGWIVEWEKEDWAGKRPKRRAGDLAGRIVWSRWCDGGKWKFNQGLTFPWHETINPDALKGTKYEWCQYADSTPNRAGLVDWLMMYNREPKIELLAKAGMYALICPAGIKALKDRRVRDWCMAHREEVARASDYRDSIVDSTAYRSGRPRTGGGSSRRRAGTSAAARGGLTTTVCARRSGSGESGWMNTRAISNTPTTPGSTCATRARSTRRRAAAARRSWIAWNGWKPTSPA